MTETESIALAKAYVALSNAHRVELIQPLFSTNAVYSSSAVGEYHGSAAIADMMRGFFARYPDVNWQCGNYHYAPGRVSFEFELRAKDTETGEQLQRNGIETIDFNTAGRIKRLDVTTA